MSTRAFGNARARRSPASRWRGSWPASAGLGCGGGIGNTAPCRRQPPLDKLDAARACAPRQGAVLGTGEEEQTAPRCAVIVIGRRRREKDHARSAEVVTKADTVRMDVCKARAAANRNDARKGNDNETPRGAQALTYGYGCPRKIRPDGAIEAEGSYAPILRGINEFCAMLGEADGTRTRNPQIDSLVL